MSNIRIIARLDIKGPNLIKGINLEGLRVIGDPHEHALQYYLDGADELLYMDVVASLYGRNSLTDVIKKTTEDIFIPLSVGGGIRSVEDVDSILRSGADKVAINTAAIKSPKLISDIANVFGSQCMILSIEAHQKSNGQWQAYYDNGREPSDKDVVDWAKHGEALGAGEIIITSVDREGTRTGFDTDLTRLVSESVSIPVIASGGFGKLEHIDQVVFDGKADAFAIADAIHYKRHSIIEIKKHALAAGLAVRPIPQ